MGNQGQVFPYDSDTVFFATLREDTDSEQGVSPSTETLVTQRADGKYFGCHSIDVAATNIVADGNCESNKPTLNSVGSDSSLTSSLSTTKAFEGSKSMRLDATYLDPGDSYFYTMGEGDQLNGMVAGNTYTFSAYVFIPVGLSVAVRLKFLSALLGDCDISWSDYSDKFGVWQRLSVTHSIDVGHDRARVEIYVYPAANEDQRVYIDGLQLEENTYHTAFVNTSRASDSRLYYATADITDMDYEKCTISFWFYYRPYEAGVYDPNNRYLFMLSAGAGDNRIYCVLSRLVDVVRVGFYTRDSNGDSTFKAWGDLETVGEGWRHVAMAWDSDGDTGLQGFLDFVELGSEASPYYIDALPSTLSWLTSGWGSGEVEERMEDIRVDKVARIEADLTAWKAWYDSVGSWRGPSRSIPAAAATLIGCV